MNINDTSITRALFKGRHIKSEILRAVLSLSDNDCICRHTAEGKVIFYSNLNVFPDRLVESVEDWEIVKTGADIEVIAKNLSLTRRDEFCFPMYLKSVCITQSCEEENEYPPKFLWCKEKDYALPRLTFEQEETLIQLIKQNG